jgi:hypothetical protein
MRRLLVVSLVAVLAGGFALGRATASQKTKAAPSGKTYVGRPGDTFRVPAAKMQCQVSTEAGDVDVLCQHTPDARYQVVFFKDNLFVYRIGKPDTPVFSAHGKP